ncbi:MAG: bacillithiol biosynthesis deacetylase BshB1, partial [Bacteroidota bacterium]|nr:bacillithiol biosynthesis deacetylase BshB1 [Bacteroidota bacterium]
MKLDILFFGAHPDDVELGCGGTVIKHVQQKFIVGIIDLTRGELGTRGTYETRDQETLEANKILGIELRENMNFKDGFFKDDENHKIELIKKIRKYKPNIVVANAPSDRHPDHGRAAAIVTDACFLSGLAKIDTNQKPWRPDAIYYYIQFNNINPDFVVDISE